MLLKLPLLNDQMSGLGTLILNKIFSYEPRVYKAISMKDDEEIKFFIDIFQHLCENNFNLLSQRDDLIRIMVKLSTSCPVERIETITDFWQKFSLHLVEKQVAVSVALEKYGEYYIEMIHGFMHMVKYDDELFMQLNIPNNKKVKREDRFRDREDYRKAIKYFFQDFVMNYGFNFFYFKILFNEFTKTVQAIQLDLNNIRNWAMLEAEIYTFLSICRGKFKFLPT